MPATISNNSESLHQYRDQISDRINELKESFKNTEIAIEKASETWKDDQFTEFQKYFHEDKGRLEPLWLGLERWHSLLGDLEKGLIDYEDSLTHC